MTDARSVVTDYEWDAINRLTTVEYPSDSALDVTLTYDLATGCGTAPKGRLCKIEDDTGTKEYQYDDLGRITDVEETRGALTFTLAYEYDLAGNVSSITLPSGREITYTRNGNGQVSGVSADVNSTPTTLASSITYLPFGPMDAMTYGNSLTFSATFDQDYYPTNRTVSGSIYNNTYDTDANGNIIQIGSTDYDYDALDRLDEEDSGSAVTYTYDATSNRLTKVNGGTTTTTVPAASNKISAVGGDSYTYDSAGNIIDDDTYEYTWDAANRLEEIELSGTSTNVGSYGYNHASQRTTKTVSSVTTHYVYGIDGQLYGEYDSSGDFIREYVYLNGAPLAQIDAGSPEVLTYIHVDHLGTSRYGTNTGGTQVWAWAGDAFGVGAQSGSVTINLRMPGQYFDTESGIFYNWNRYYNPAIGRYITSDPIGLDGGINTFLYADASPIMNGDFEGLRSAKCTFNPREIGCLMFEGGPGGGGGTPRGTTKASAFFAAAATAAATGIFEICDRLIGAIYNSKPAQTPAPPGFDVKDTQAKAEHKAYKARAKSPNPNPDPNDPCDEIEYKLKRAERVIEDMKAWDKKWWPEQYTPRHAEPIAQRERQVKNLKAELAACRSQN